jgi:2-amino-4-hydroxy-6-hydroxymethyldihydropteridine diphosphokinase/dihydropteroate synthase
MKDKLINLGLGSNLGDRRQNLTTAISHIQKIFVKDHFKISHVYETPALLLGNADPSWNKPFLNLAVQGYFDGTPEQLLFKIKEIEKIMGRALIDKWAPRNIDIDILFCEDFTFKSTALTIPHPELFNRSFVLDPLKDLDFKFCRSARRLPQHSPVWMGILNVTPDSFSDGGKYFTIERIGNYLEEVEDHVGILDVGAESTRPGASVLSGQQEWERLENVLKFLNARYSDKLLRPKISVDTRHPKVAAAALELKVDIINDVSGLADPEMISILQNSDCQYVLMHSLTIPADPKINLPHTEQACFAVKNWFEEKINLFEKNKISLDRIILDPGIGFNKDSLQSLDILRNTEVFMDLPCRFLIGHSRKSFIKDFSDKPAEDRDLESIGVSLNMIRRGVDILRVHNPMAHIRAFRGFNHS